MLLYTNELESPPAKPSLGLLRFKATSPKPLRDKYTKLLSKFSSYSTVHGMNNVFDLSQRYWLRCFWLTVVIFAFAGCFAMYSVLAQRHDEQQLITVIETTQLPVYNIEFPAIAVCPWNHVNWLRAKSAADRFLPVNAGDSVRQIFYELLIGMEGMTFGNFESLGTFAGRNLSVMADLSVAEVASYVAYRCDELFVPNSCVFDETPHDCCKLFVLERTEKGQCLVFNSLISDDSRKKQLISPYYPYKLSRAGESSGLEFTLHLNSSFLRPGTKIPFAMNLMVKEPSQWTHSMTYHLYENTENFISIHPVVFEASNNAYYIKPSRRHCYLKSEKNPYFTRFPDLTYNRQNCLTVCMQRAVIRLCNCTLPLYFPPANTRECGIMDFQCLHENSDVFSYVKVSGQDKFIRDRRRGQNCPCYNSCSSRQYKLGLNVRQFSYKTNATKMIKAEIYYSQRVMTKYVTKLEYTHVDLLTNFGGILGLYVGASALSFAELGYVAIQLLWKLFQDALVARQKTRVTAIH